MFDLIAQRFNTKPENLKSKQRPLEQLPEQAAQSVSFLHCRRGRKLISIVLFAAEAFNPHYFFGTTFIFDINDQSCNLQERRRLQQILPLKQLKRLFSSPCWGDGLKTSDVLFVYSVLKLFVLTRLKRR